MKIICITFFFLSTVFSCKPNVSNNSFKKIIIEWVGEIDKPIKTIKICTSCKNDLKQNQFKTSKVTFDSIVDILKLKFDDEFLINISINESNRSIQKQNLKNIQDMLKRSRENEKLIDELETFIRRIE